jgi:hypothetical protein
MRTDRHATQDEATSTEPHVFLKDDRRRLLVPPFQSLVWKSLWVMIAWLPMAQRSPMRINCIARAHSRN